MLSGKFSLAVSPEGDIFLPPNVRRELARMYGSYALMGFGVQFLYLCEQREAESLLRQIDAQLLAAFPANKRQVNRFLSALSDSVAMLSPDAKGKIHLPTHLLDLLEHKPGELLTLFGVEDHLELWNGVCWRERTQALERNVQLKKTDVSLLETPICLQREEACSMLRNGRPQPKICGQCVRLRLP
jgi:DNA-binding transcriptional regulator/RsmH inhibitor MraZ